MKVSIQDKNEINLQQLNKNLEKIKIQSLLMEKLMIVIVLLKSCWSRGTESQDWAEMLMRMYERFARKMTINLVNLYQKGEKGGN
ncbi:MAG: hypothetical protein CM15mP70_08280 [Pelagibacteraceae bacterium]|nr:MAG: hypothetical protein CM15mP70_08280 [Pelagibacteraceae bacterium]